MGILSGSLQPGRTEERSRACGTDIGWPPTAGKVLPKQVAAAPRSVTGAQMPVGCGMNFIGHLAVARWFGADPAVGFGAMLPDFCSMAGVRPARPTAIGVPPSLATGLALHVRTDAAFHGTATFIGLCADGALALAAPPLGRGSVRAAAHLAVELFLDGELLHRGTPGHRTSGRLTMGEVTAARVTAGDGSPAPETLELTYAAALAAAADLRLGEAIPGAGDRARIESLRLRLIDWGAPLAYRDSQFVGDRLVSILNRRPRLALDAAATEAMRRALPAVQTLVQARAPALLTELSLALGVEAKTEPVRP